MRCVHLLIMAALGITMLGRSAHAQIETREGDRWFRVGARDFMVPQGESLSEGQVRHILRIATACYEDKKNYDILQVLWDDLDKLYDGPLLDDILFVVFKAGLNHTFDSLRAFDDATVAHSARSVASWPEGSQLLLGGLLVFQPHHHEGVNTRRPGRLTYRAVFRMFGPTTKGTTAFHELSVKRGSAWTRRMGPTLYSDRGFPRVSEEDAIHEFEWLFVEGRKKLGLLDYERDRLREFKQAVGTDGTVFDNGELAEILAEVPKKVLEEFGSVFGDSPARHIASQFANAYIEFMPEGAREKLVRWCRENHVEVQIQERKRDF